MDICVQLLPTKLLIKSILSARQIFLEHHKFSKTVSILEQFYIYHVANGDIYKISWLMTKPQPRAKQFVFHTLPPNCLTLWYFIHAFIKVPHLLLCEFNMVFTNSRTIQRHMERQFCNNQFQYQSFLGKLYVKQQNNRIYL